MSNILLKKIKSVRTVPFESRGVRPIISAFFILFFIGIFIGSCVGIFSGTEGLPTDIETYISSGIVSTSIFQSIFYSFRFIALALVFSTSYLGIFLVPSLVLIRAYSLSCSVAALISAYSYSGLALSAFVTGIPLLFTIPCFAIIACDSFRLSRQLFWQHFHSSPPAWDSQAIRHFLITFPIVALEAFYSYYILPLILSKLY